MTSFVQKHGRQCTPRSAKFSRTLQTEILSTEFSDFLKQIIFLKPFNGLAFETIVEMENPHVIDK